MASIRNELSYRSARIATPLCSPESPSSSNPPTTLIIPFPSSHPSILSGVGVRSLTSSSSEQSSALRTSTRIAVQTRRLIENNPQVPGFVELNLHRSVATRVLMLAQAIRLNKQQRSAFHPVNFWSGLVESSPSCHIQPISLNSIHQPMVDRSTQPARRQIHHPVEDLSKSKCRRHAHHQHDRIGRRDAQIVIQVEYEPKLDTGSPEDDGLRGEETCGLLASSTGRAVRTSVYVLKARSPR